MPMTGSFTEVQNLKKKDVEIVTIWELSFTFLWDQKP